MTDRILKLVAGSVLVIALTGSSVDAGDPNALTRQEKAAGFQVLFSGEDLDGWKHSGNWKVQDGTVARTGGGGSLVYTVKEIPDSFELKFHWKVARGSNSGVYYRPGQYEYQILDNDVHSNGKNPRTSAASLYFCMAPSHDATKPAGEWNTGRIVGKGTIIQHWLNGEKVVHFDYSDPKWAFNVELLKKRGGDLSDRGAHLSLQDHGDPVWYRAIKLRELSADDEIDMEPVEPSKVPEEARKAEQKKIERILKRRGKQ